MSKKLRIMLFDLAADGHHVNYISYITRYLVEQGDEVTLVTWKPDSRLDPIVKGETGVTVEYVMGESAEAYSVEKPSRLRQFKQLLKGIEFCHRLANQRRPDIVHHLSLEYSELALYLRAKSTRLRHWRLFGTLFWTYFLPDPGERMGLPKRFYYRANQWAFGRVLKQRKLDYMFVHSSRTKQILVECYNDDSLNRRIFVVPDAIEPLQTMRRETVRKELGLPQDKPLILFFGVLHWYKGVDILFEALGLLDGDWYAVVAGKPAEFGEREAQRCRQRLREPGRLITRLGFIPDDEMVKYYFAADAVVLPYRRAFKGTSGIFQHAAAAGKPLIVTDVGDIGPTVRDNELGIVVEPESVQSLAAGIQSFLQRRDELSSEVKPHALRYAATLDWRIMAKKIHDAYQTAMAD